MNRQALPSIVLSVSIVCFFAVALYQRDPDPRSGAGRTTPAKPEAGVGPTARAGGAGPGNASRSSPTPTARSPADPGALTVRTDAPGAARGIATVGGQTVNDRVAGASDRERGAVASTAVIRMASNHPGRPLGSPSGSPPVAADSLRGAERRTNRTAFTVVGSNETIADVARRVYGNSEDAEALWRANRDVLPEPGSPLSPGMMLRTPAPALR
jgi:hypothetical protein